MSSNLGFVEHEVKLNVVFELCSVHRVKCYQWLFDVAGYNMTEFIVNQISASLDIKRRTGASSSDNVTRLHRTSSR